MDPGKPGKGDCGYRYPVLGTKTVLKGSEQSLGAWLLGSRAEGVLLLQPLTPSLTRVFQKDDPGPLPKES